jgi:hypothetical protein
MTPLDFIASLDGEAKAAALTVYNLMTPVWIEITDDPATLPQMGTTVILRENSANRLERVGWFDRLFPDTGSPCWFKSQLAFWSKQSQTIEPATPDSLIQPPTHWRPIA